MKNRNIAESSSKFKFKVQSSDMVYTLITKLSL